MQKVYGIATVYLFGSYARGEAREDSDLDFYIESGKLTSLFQYAGFICDLEEVFDRHVNVVTNTIDDKIFWEIIKKKKRFTSDI